MVSVAPAIPPLPVAHARALALLSAHTAEPGEVAAVIESDPSLTAGVLRAANSAGSSPLVPVRTAHDAIIRVGMGTARRLIAGVALGQTFRRLASSGLDTDELWRHLLATAVIADATAWADGPRTQAFTAGLLHDVGRLAMAAQDPARYSRVVVLARAGFDPSEVERDLFGTDHAAWGAAVAEQWSLPAEVVAAIAAHHDGGGDVLGLMVWQARHVATLIGLGDGLLPPPEGARGPEHEMVSTLGGATALLQEVEWYRGAVSVHS